MFLQSLIRNKIIDVKVGLFICHFANITAVHGKQTYVYVVRICLLKFKLSVLSLVVFVKQQGSFGF